MNKTEATEILNKELSDLREKEYTELVEIIDNVITKEVTGESDQTYQVEIQALWDSKEKGYLRVMVSIDDGGLRAFAPLTDDFIMAPSGNMVMTGKISKLN